MELSNTYVKIDLDAIRENYHNLCKKAGVPVMAVVKADAYGHGAVQVAKALEGCPYFGVSSVAEALELRSAGIQKPILILGHAHPAHYKTLVEQNIRPTIFNFADAVALSEAAGEQKARCHIAVDTGMSRIGFQVNEESADLCKKISQLPGVVIEGVFSHFSKADEEDLTFAEKQRAAFDRFLDLLKDRGVEVPVKHLDNSAGILNFSGHYDMARGGISLYGLYPSDQVDKNLLKLTPAMSWHSRISNVKTLEAGRAISYGGIFVTEKETVVATVPAGYADGYRRCLGNRFYVLIKGKKAPILGKVCMDQFMVDVTDIPGVVPGDPVTLMGKDGEAQITAEALGEAAYSFNYEQVCDISRRVERVYIQGGKETGRRNYLTEK